MVDDELAPPAEERRRAFLARGSIEEIGLLAASSPVINDRK
jgi:hypothetical protein